MRGKAEGDEIAMQPGLPRPAQCDNIAKRGLQASFAKSAHASLIAFAKMTEQDGACRPKPKAVEPRPKQLVVVGEEPGIHVSNRT